jgi:glycosyltransferase involved in cell wall biosynthesis
VFLVSTFGIVGKEKGMELCASAIDLLRSWHIPAELYFVGNVNYFKDDLKNICHRYGVTDYVHYFDHFLDEDVYREFLIASDAALQLRVYGLGQLSAALMDCISAGLPSVATKNLAESCEAPGYVSTVPDRFSPLQIAEQLALIWGCRNGHAAWEEARTAYLSTHNFEYYGKRLVEILDLA